MDVKDIQLLHSIFLQQVRMRRRAPCSAQGFSALSQKSEIDRIDVSSMIFATHEYKRIRIWTALQLTGPLTLHSDFSHACDTFQTFHPSLPIRPFHVAMVALKVKEAGSFNLSYQGLLS